MPTSSSAAVPLTTPHCPDNPSDRHRPAADDHDYHYRPNAAPQPPSTRHSNALDAPGFDSSNALTTAQNPNFVAHYFAASRLHFIGSFRARYESMMLAVAARLNRPVAQLMLAPTPPPARHRSIVHVDMDAFFASVAVRDAPHLRGTPVAVCHAPKSDRPGDGSGKGGEISSCSYEARAKGVKAGMFLGRAREMCPELVAVAYDFVAYERASVDIYALFYGVGGVVQAASIDEAYLDLTGVVGEDEVEGVVAKLREDIYQVSGCRASAGIGPCKLVARLATGRGKPNGQVRVLAEEVGDFVLGVSVKSLPGIGYRTRKKMREMDIETCEQLRAVRLSLLQAKFGNKLGQAYYDVCRGLDTTPIEPLKPRKSIGAEASWGVRFAAGDDAKVAGFVSDLAREVAARCTEASAVGKKVTLKIYKARANAGRPGKYLGHGPCHILNKSGPVIAQSAEDLPAALIEACLKLYNGVGVKSEELRGLGVQCNDVVFDGFFTDQRSAANGHIQSYFAVPGGPVDTVASAAAPVSVGVDVDEVRSAHVAAEEERLLGPEHDINGEESDSVDEPKALTPGATQFALRRGYDPEVYRNLPAFMKCELKAESAAQGALLDRFNLGSSGGGILNSGEDDNDDDDDDVNAWENGNGNVAGYCNEATRHDGVEAGRGLQDELPSQWNAPFFVDLPRDVQEELLEEHRRSSKQQPSRSSPVKQKKRRLHQQTLAEMIGPVPKKRVVKPFVDEDYDFIPTPPVLKSDAVELCRAARQSDAVLYADESLASYAGKVRAFIERSASDVRTAHVEVLRTRILDFVARRKLGRATNELKAIRLFVMEVGGREWRDAFNVLLGDVQRQAATIVHAKLAIRPLKRIEEKD